MVYSIFLMVILSITLSLEQVFFGASSLPLLNRVFYIFLHAICSKIVIGFFFFSIGCFSPSL